MKIYTKTGDKGETSLFGGKRVPKYDVRINAYGTSDELNSFIGLIRDQDIAQHYKDVLLNIQDKIFVLGATLAADPDKPKLKKPDLLSEDVELLEKEIDQMNETLPEMTHFILPGGHTTVSYCHIARCVCRRCERLVIELSTVAEVDEIVIQYLNRLSDYLFVLGRKIAQDVGIEEVKWIPKK
jgi:cob(I)alamin adenosyltransferase